MSDKFFTFMVVPESSERVRKFTLPVWYLKGGAIAAFILLIIGLFIFFDYLHVLSQVAENKRLQTENRQLASELQTSKVKLEALDQSVSRLKSFAHKLRVISNLDQPGAQKLLSAPIPGEGTPGTKSGSGTGFEDSGMIEEPGTGGKPSSEYVPPSDDIHAQLEYQRSLTVLGELGQSFSSKNLVERARQISKAADTLNNFSVREEKLYADLQEQVQDRVTRLLSTPSSLPAQGWISSEFGYRMNPFSGSKTFHAGIDVANVPATSVVAPADGVVTNTGIMGGFGLVVRLDHGYGLVTKYGHNSRILVKPGQRVKRGDRLAEMGSSGRSTGTHLHYQVEVRGRPVNPRLFILEDVF